MYAVYSLAINLQQRVPHTQKKKDEISRRLRDCKHIKIGLQVYLNPQFKEVFSLAKISVVESYPNKLCKKRAYHHRLNEKIATQMTGNPRGVCLRLEMVKIIRCRLSSRLATTSCHPLLRHAFSSKIPPTYT